MASAVVREGQEQSMRIPLSLVHEIVRNEGDEDT